MDAGKIGRRSEMLAYWEHPVARKQASAKGHRMRAGILRKNFMPGWGFSKNQSTYNEQSWSGQNLPHLAKGRVGFCSC